MHITLGTTRRDHGTTACGALGNYLRALRHNEAQLNLFAATVTMCEELQTVCSELVAAVDLDAGGLGPVRRVCLHIGLLRIGLKRLFSSCVHSAIVFLISRWVRFADNGACLES